MLNKQRVTWEGSRFNANNHRFVLLPRPIVLKAEQWSKQLIDTRNTMKTQILLEFCVVGAESKELWNTAYTNNTYWSRTFKFHLIFFWEKTWENIPKLNWFSIVTLDLISSLNKYFWKTCGRLICLMVTVDLCGKGSANKLKLIRPTTFWKCSILEPSQDITYWH